MQLAIIGAGITGVCTAHALAAAGHTVTVLERRNSVAAEGSFAQSGLCAAMAPLPWGLPAVPQRLLARWLGPHGVLQLGSAAAGLRWGWWRKHFSASRGAAAVARQAALQALALDSRRRLLALQAELGLAFDQADGLTVLVRDAKQARRIRDALGHADGDDAPRWLDADTCRRLEPHLASSLPLEGGVRLAHSGVGNARQLAHQLKAAAQRLGACFEFNTPVRSLQPGEAPAVVTDADHARRFDAVVVCAGAGSAQLLARAGQRLPFQTIQRFALTAPLALVDGHAHAGPLGGVVDAASGIGVARIGERVRVTGVASCGGSLQRQLPWAMARLDQALEALYPGAAISRRAQQWGGARALLPDGAPVIGRSALPGIWLNTGHGGTGWPVACGSAQLLEQLLAGHAVEGPMAWLGAARLR